MDCIDLFKRAAMALQTDPRYVILDQARKANDKDEELQNLIGEFNLARMDLNNEIGKSERNDARIAELNEKVNSLYGQIRATLPLSPRYDVDTFIRQAAAPPERLLSRMTGGVHLHTLRCPDKDTFARIRDALEQQGLLYRKE